jgi:uncharacterized membrane protein YhfC
MKLTRIIFIGLGLVILVWIMAFLLSNPTFIAPFFNGFLMIAIPLALAIYLTRNLKVGWRLFGLGAATFILSQVLHIPFNSWVLNPFVAAQGWEMTKGSPDLALIGLVFGLSAGLFEETARYIFYKFSIKEERRWKDGLIYGLGHGGTEAMILGVIVMYVFLQIVVINGVAPEALGELVGVDQVETVQAQVNTYLTTPWYDHLLGAMERVSAIIVQISLALLVLQAFTRRNFLWYLAAVLYHTIIDAFAVYALPTWGAYLTEVIILGFALASLGMIYAFYKAEPPEPEPEIQADPLPLPTPQRVQENIKPEKLEDSRYD